MTAREFIVTLDQMHVHLFLAVDRGRYGYAYRADPRYEDCFPALARHFDVKARREELCNTLMWMDRIEDRRPLAITAQGTRVYQQGAPRTL